MARVEKVMGGCNPLSITRRKGRQVSRRRFINPRIRVRCGCGCGRTVDIVHEQKLHEIGTIEINGVVGSLAQWREILRPILGFSLASYREGTPESGHVDSEWCSTV